MNWNQGLKRLSLVWWGICVLFFLSGSFMSMFDYYGNFAPIQEFKSWKWPVFLLCSSLPLVLHKITCWIIDGFTRNG